ncbi:MAG: hypothetical protein ACLGHC_06895 [Alphaproteobacteria bacterium]
MGELRKITSRGRRLKGLEEFETPEFVGRMARVERQRSLVWRGAVVAMVVLGGTIGLLL